MPDPNSIEKDFLSKLSEIVQENISDEMFGVSELANEIGMSRSNLLRKIKKLTQLSVSQYIRQIRLQRALEILLQDTLTVSEVSYNVGFSSISYFIKCFGDYYGYPPGEAKKRSGNENDFKQTLKTSQSHQLAAIMFTDIQGYTALMQKDEDKALEFRDRHREIFNSLTKKFNGKILQYYGDGTLSIFDSAIDAVKCAIELQLEYLTDPVIPIRIGIHTGDIIYSNEEIIGDGVNVASRIESLATAGSVFISEKVYDEVKNQPSVQTISLGEFDLKNVDKPVEVFAITNPGLVVPRNHQIKNIEKTSSQTNKKESILTRKRAVIWSLLVLLAVIIGYAIYSLGIFEINTDSIPISFKSNTKKSIAVLPFINDSNDSTNVYIINGLMESILNNLQKIEGLRVLSRTSVEKYRNNPKAVQEIAKELKVKYLIEGSGQKIGDQIMLHIQLIEASSDQHLWSEQYNKKAKDIFSLQVDVAKNIADKIEVILTPEEKERISKAPTNNLVAYDFFLKGLDLLHKQGRSNLENAIPFFEKAIEHDPEYARAYAAIAMTYYFLDVFQVEKKYTEQINHYADQALLFDAQLPQSLIAKALFYIQNEEYELAVSYLEKALEFNPNYDLGIGFLVDLYVNHIPDTEKYLEYALKQIDITANDSLFASVSYLHISNAFIQAGFIDEAVKYIDISLDYNPENLYSAYTKAFILYARDRDLQQTKDLLIDALDKDSTRIDIMQEIGKIYYYMRDYESALPYYKKYLELKKAWNLDIFRSENAKIAVVFEKMGLTEESEQLFSAYKNYAENDPSIYKHLNLAMYFSYKGDQEKAIENLKLFSQQNHYSYWTVVFVEMNPLLDNIKNHPQFKDIFNDIDSKFWDWHMQIKSSLEEKELL